MDVYTEKCEGRKILYDHSPGDGEAINRSNIHFVPFSIARQRLIQSMIETLGSDKARPIPTLFSSSRQNT